MAKPTRAQAEAWIEAIRAVKEQMAEFELETDDPAEEAFYHLDAAIDHLYEVN